MQIDSLFSSLNELFKLGSTEQADGVEAPPAAAGRTEIQRSFSAASARDWCELVRDIVALANSGGGHLVLSGSVNEQEILQHVGRYTDATPHGLEVRCCEPPDLRGTVVIVGPAILPIGFTRAGVCPTSADSAEQEEIFPAGSFYFRHAGRSEPATTADMRAFCERLLRRVRRRWLRGLRRVLNAPIDLDRGAVTKRSAAKRKQRELMNLQPVRIVTDPEAPALQPQDVDRLYPWRQKDLLRELNSRIGRRALNSYDIQAVRRQHHLDERPEFVFNLPGAGRRYSPASADWMMQQFGDDPEFFRRARHADHEMLKLRRQKPK
jgi:hypothetical protein